MTMTEDEVFNAINTSKIVRQSGQEFYMSVDDNGYGEIRTVPSFFDNYADAQMKKSEAIEGAVKKAGDVITSTPEFIYGGIKAAPVGLAKFGEEMMNTVFPYYNDNVVPWLENNLPEYNEMNEYLNDVLSPKSKVQEYGAMIGEPLGQLVVPGAGLSKGLKVYGFGNKFLRNVLGYGTAEVIGMTPDEEGLLELGTMLFVKNEMLRDAIFESLSANEDLPYLLQKIQKAPQRFLEGGLIGEGLDKALESVGVLYKGIKDSPELKSSLEKIDLPTDSSKVKNEKMLDRPKNPKNLLKYKGKETWGVIVDNLDNEVIGSVPFEKAQAADFHHSFYMSEKFIKKIDDGDYSLYVDNDDGLGLIEGRGEEVPPAVKKRILEQVEYFSKSRKN